MNTMLRPIAEVATELGVSKDTLERRIRAGLLAKFKRGRRTLVDDGQARRLFDIEHVSGPDPATDR